MVAFIATAPDPKPNGAVGQRLFGAGPFEVAEREYQLEDAARERALRVTVWYPAEVAPVASAAAQFPLLVSTARY